MQNCSWLESACGATASAEGTLHLCLCYSTIWLRAKQVLGTICSHAETPPLIFAGILGLCNFGVVTKAADH